MPAPVQLLALRPPFKTRQTIYDLWRGLQPQRVAVEQGRLLLQWSACGWGKPQANGRPTFLVGQPQAP